MMMINGWDNFTGDSILEQLRDDDDELQLRQTLVLFEKKFEAKKIAAKVCFGLVLENLGGEIDEMRLGQILELF